MSTVEEVIGILKNFAPEEKYYAAEYDNVGLLCGDGSASVTKALVCLDVTETVLDEAVNAGAELIISHHPFIFGSIGRVNAADLMGRKILTRPIE